VRFSLAYDLQLPRPWTPDKERALFRDTLDQVARADRLGCFHAVRLPEHHFLEEYSHASAPGVLLGAAAARTDTIRLGLGALLPQHPARVAEALATLDLVSDGRAELAVAEAATGVERAAFGLRRAAVAAQADETLRTIARMLAESRSRPRTRRCGRPARAGTPSAARPSAASAR
jgi:alkanesulfonate monooxygenase SsuD/methylene tetrahydromethanopterin reductase-like flavin-dependent oxidoreductase (luciferase family)